MPALYNCCDCLYLTSYSIAQRRLTVKHKNTILVIFLKGSQNVLRTLSCIMQCT